MLGYGVVLSVEMNGPILCQVGHKTILTFYAKSLRIGLGPGHIVLVFLLTVLRTPVCSP